MLNPNREGLRYYSHGEYKDLYRGCLHEYTSIGLLYLMTLTYFNIPTYSLFYEKNTIMNHNYISELNFKIFIYSFLKFLSYSSSAIFHRYPFKVMKYQDLAEKIDLIGINISIYGTGIVLINDYQFYNNISLYFIILSLILIKFRCINTRVINSIIYSKITFYMVYLNINKYNILLSLSFYFYLISGILFLFKLLSKNNILLPWHSKNIYGYHEDFHLFLLLADVSILFLIINNHFNSVSYK